jgi:hypothetical protein
LICEFVNKRIYPLYEIFSLFFYFIIGIILNKQKLKLNAKLNIMNLWFLNIKYTQLKYIARDVIKSMLNKIRVYIYILIYD